MNLEKVQKKKDKMLKLKAKIEEMQHELEVLRTDYFIDLGKEIEGICIDKELDLKDLAPLFNAETFENIDGGEDEIAQ